MLTRCFARVAWVCATIVSIPVAARDARGQAAGTTTPVRPLAETLSGQARADYEAGRTLVTDGDFAGATIKFQAAYDVSKDARLLWNLAACEKSMRHYARAIELIRRYISEGGGRLTEKDQREADELVKTLAPFTVALLVEVSEPDAQIEIDDKPAGKSPLPRPIVVDIGQRKVRAHKHGFREAVVTSPVGGSPQQTVTLQLEKDVHEGTIAIQAPTSASLFVDGRPLGPGKGTAAVVSTFPSGGHTVRVTAPGMRLYEREVVVKDDEARVVDVILERELDPVAGAGLRGSLPTEAGFGSRGPAGNPDWGRVALGVWIPGSFGTDDGGVVANAEARPELEGVHYRLDGVGVFVQPGIAFRWWTAMLDVGLAKGSATMSEPPRLGAPDVVQRVQTADLSWLRTGFRTGARLPLSVAALSLGVGGGYDNVVVDNLAPGLSWTRSHELYVSAWAGVEAYAFCDWAVVGAFSADLQMLDDKRGVYGIQIGAAFQPNSRCHEERREHELGSGRLAASVRSR
jgi:hypothetical protein